MQRLCELLENTSRDMLTIVFTETKKGADFLDNFLHYEGYHSTCIHGDRNQREREAAVELFKVRVPGRRIPDFYRFQILDGTNAYSGSNCGGRPWVGYKQCSPCDQF